MNEQNANAKSDIEASDLGLRIFRALKSTPDITIVNVVASLAHGRDVAALRTALATGLVDGDLGLLARANLACHVAPLRVDADPDTEHFVDEWVSRLRMDDPDAIGSCLMQIGAEHRETALKLLNANPLAMVSGKDGLPDPEVRSALEMAFYHASREAVGEMLDHLAEQDRLPLAGPGPDGTAVSYFQKMMEVHNVHDRLRIYLPALSDLSEKGVPASWSHEIGSVLHRATTREGFRFFSGKNKQQVECLLMSLATMDEPKQWHDILDCCPDHEVAGWLAADETLGVRVIKNMLRDGVAPDDIKAKMLSFGECTLLHKAVEFHNLTVVELLLENGADPMALTQRQDNSGNVLEKQWDAIGMARRNDYPDVVQMIQAWQAQQAIAGVAGAARAALAAQ